MLTRSAVSPKDDLSSPRAKRPDAGATARNSLRDRSALLARLADQPNLPRPPGVVLQVLEKASRLDCSPTELASAIHRDPVLCGKILKVVNSALYSLPRAITSIERAVALLGFKPLRSLVLSLSLPALQRAATQAPGESFWKESVAGAIIARQLAQHLRRPSPDDDLVAGLLRDLGMLALQQAHGKEYTDLLARPLEELAQKQCSLEEQTFGVSHAEVSAFLLARWRLPEEITEAIRHHHTTELPADLPHPIAERARLLTFASRLAQLQVGSGCGPLLRDILTFAAAHYGMSEVDLRAFLEPLASKIDEFATHMNLDIGASEHYPTVLARAAEELVKLTVETNVDKLRILEQKQQVEAEKQHWREQAHRLCNEVLRDPLTDAFNRGCFEKELVRTFRRARRRGTVVGLIFLDLDDFKSVNDRFGHPFGDRVLKETADNLFAAVRQGDIVARYGGDEFCVLIENTSPDGMRRMAERLWQDLNERTIRDEDHVAAIRASLGVVLCMPRTYAHSAAEFLAVADRAMYSAKFTGKNQITFLSLLTEADSNWLSAVEERLFSVWLARQDIWKAEQLGVGVRRAGSRFEAPGRLSRRMGWLTTAQLRLLLGEQRTTRRRFEEIALERGQLTPAHFLALLALQLEPPEGLAANLVNQGILGEAAMRENLRKFYGWLQSTLS